MKKMEVTKIRMMRKTCNGTLLDDILNEAIRKLVGSENDQYEIEETTLPIVLTHTKNTRINNNKKGWAVDGSW